MNIEVMAWASLAAGLATFSTMTIRWIPQSFKFLLWFCGLSFMGFAMVYLVSVYDPPRVNATIEFAYWLMLASRIAVPLLAVYIYLKWGSRSLRLMAVVAFLTSACGNSTDIHPNVAAMVMSGLIVLSLWLLMESVYYAIDKEENDFPVVF